MKYIAMYTNCREGRLGDYSTTAAVAYSLQTYLNSRGVQAQIVLLSDEKGVDRFKQLYSDHDILLIHDLKFRVASLNEYMQSPYKKDTTHFIDAGSCSPAPMQVIKEFAAQGANILFVGFAIDKENAFKLRVKSTARKASIPSDKLNSVLMGYGGKRIGMPLYTVAPAPVKHENYLNLTKQPYGCVYFKTSENAVPFIASYLSITDHPQINCHSHVMVGALSTVLESAKQFVMQTGKQVKVIDEATNEVHLLRKISEEVVDVVKSPLNANSLTGETTTILVKKEISNEDMRALVKEAIPLVAVTGVGQMLLAVEMQKIPFYQYLHENSEFISDYTVKVWGKDINSPFIEGNSQKEFIDDESHEELLKYIAIKDYAEEFNFISAISEEKIDEFAHIVGDNDFQAALIQAQNQLLPLSVNFGVIVAEHLTSQTLSNQPSTLFASSKSATQSTPVVLSNDNQVDENTQNAEKQDIDTTNTGP